MKLVALILMAFAALVFLTGVVHELVHLTTALAMGVPVLDFAWFDSRYMAPRVTFGLIGSSFGTAVVLYSGGLVTGTLLLIVYSIYFVHKKYSENSIACWAFGLLIALVAFGQVGQGMLEGRLHQIYISGAGKPGSVSFIIQCFLMSIGIAVHLWQTHLWRGLLHRNSPVRD